MRTKRALSMILCALLMTTAFAFFGTNTVVAESSPVGEANCFEVTNSTYLNVTLCSSEVVNVTLESIPMVVSFTIEATTSAPSTSISMSGFEPGRTYYRHEDGHLMESFVADQEGNYSYTQDLSRPHHVFIQEEVSTKFIQDNATGGECYLIGTWDFLAKTCMLTSDVFEMIVIDANGITLDGGGHSVTKGIGSYGIYASSRSEITITNAMVSGFSYGIRLYHSSSSTISGNTVSGNGWGIYLSSSGSSTISGNTVSGNNGYGIFLGYSGSNTLRDNVMASNTYNFGVVGTTSLSHYIQDIDTSNTVDGRPIYYWVGHSYETVPSDAGYVGIVDSDHITVQDLTLTRNTDGVLFAYTSDSTIQNVVVWGNNRGIYLRFSSSSTVSGNTISGNGYGIRLEYSDTNTITGNTVSGGGYSIYLAHSSSNTISGNTVSGGRYGIDLRSSSSNTISGNTVSGGNYGIHLHSSSSSTLRDNAMASNTYNFVVVGSSLSDYIQDIDTSNTVDGRPIYYWVNHYYETVPSNAGYVGIVDSDHITVQDLTLTNNGKGVLFAYTSDSTIQNVVVSGNIYGIYLFSSSSNTISGNTVSGNNYGIRLWWYSSSNTINGNTVSGNVYTGIFLEYSDTNTITGNTVSGGNYGIRMRYSGSSTISGNTVSGNDRGIYLRYSGSNTISGNTVSGNTYGDGIRLFSSSSNTVSGNTVSGNGNYGINLDYSDSNTISGNTVSGNYNGIRLSRSDSNTISGNTVSNNNYGIYLRRYSDSNTIFHNNIIDNANQLYNDQSSNTWDNGDGEGNYWSDYTGLDDGSGGRVAGDGVGDTLLPHQGVDWYPLMDPWNHDPFDAIEKLKKYIEGLDIPHGIKNSLISQLNAAENALSNGQENAAVNILNAFIHHVEALRNAGKLTQEQAEHMISSAQAIIETIESG